MLQLLITFKSKRTQGEVGFHPKSGRKVQRKKVANKKNQTKIALPLQLLPCFLFLIQA